MWIDGQTKSRTETAWTAAIFYHSDPKKLPKTAEALWADPKATKPMTGEQMAAEIMKAFI